MKKIITKIKVLIKENSLRLCQIIINKLSNNINDNSNSTYSSLMPKADVDISNYESALDHTFSSSEQIKNIALMGAYGSGKSSIINTYANKHPELKFLHISLAHFSDNTELLNNRIKGLKSTIPKENNKVNENKADKIDKTTIANFLEGKILNQLIHQIDPCNISDSNFAIKQPLSKFKKTLYTVSLFIFTISIIYATLYNK